MINRGAITEFVAKLHEAEPLDGFLDDASNDVTEIKHQAHLLMCDLEDKLATTRGTMISPTQVSLSFTVESIDATLYLAGGLWAALAELDKRLDVRLAALNEADLQRVAAE